MRDSSPEERLLRLIRGEKKLKPSETPGDAVSSGRPRKKLSSKFSRLQIRDIQRLSWIILLISFVYLLICITRPLFVRQKQQLHIVKERGEEGLKSGALDSGSLTAPETKPYSFYQQAITGRQIFSSSGQATGRTQAQSDSTTIERIKDLNLLGIISGDSPEAVIEDKRTEKTYFLKRGEFLDAIKVQEIGEGKVSLELQGQRFDLYL